MNVNCYKIIFSKRLGILVAVGEHTTSTGKAASGQARRGRLVADGFLGALRFSFASFALACITLSNTQAQSSNVALSASALPQGASINTGSASISTQGTKMAITQATDKASINWQGFNIGTAASVNIAQPSTSSVLLNRVVGNDPSQILGKLSANGQVILLNPNGIVFGKDGSVTASSFTASTFALSDADFMSGFYKYNRNGSNASVVNQGTIETTAGGFVALIGATVTNEGTIRSPQGDVVLAAAESVTLPTELIKPQPPTTPNTVSVRMSKRVRLELDPAAINTAVNNTQSGVIVTEGGQVLLQAATLSSAVASVTHSGRIDTSAPQAGAVTVLGDNGVIKVDGSITANSSGSDGQGQVRKGGEIIIGRDLETGVLAKATDVSGAKLESQAGFVETSGEYLASSGVKVKAAEWLLDPNNIEINATNVAVTAGNTVVLAADIAGALTAGTTVTIATGTGPGSASSATGVNQATVGTGNTSAGTIAVNSAINSTYAGATNPTLTLSAASNIAVSAAITTTGSNIVLQSTGGAISNTAAISGRNVSIDNTGGTINAATGAITKGVSAGTTGVAGVTISENITASGNLNVYGLTTDNTGVSFNATKTLSGGNIQIIGQTGGVYGATVSSGASVITTGTSGDSLLKGIGASVNSGGQGALAIGNATLRAAAGTTLTMEGQATTVAADVNVNTRGIRIDGTVDTYGDITLTGTSGSNDGFLLQAGQINIREGALKINGTIAANGGGWRGGVNISRPIYLYNNTTLAIVGKAANQSAAMTPTQFEQGVSISGAIEAAAGQTTAGDISITGFTSSAENSVGALINSNITTAGNIKIIGQTLGSSTGSSVNLNSVINSTAGNVTVQSIGGRINQVAAKTITARNITIDNTGAGLSSLIADTTAGLNLSVGTSMGGSINNATGAVTAGSALGTDGITLNANLTASGNINIQGTRASAGTGINIASTSTLTSTGVGASINAKSNYNVVHSGAITNQASGGVAASINMSSSSGNISGAGSIASNGVSTSGGGITIDTTTAGTLSGVISGSGSLTKIGAGTTSLSNYQTYSGATNVNAGTLSFTTPLTSYATATTLGNQYRSTQFNIAAGATLDFNIPTNVTMGNGESSTTTFNGLGTLSKTGGGKIQWLIWDNTFNMSAGSLIDIQAGTFLASSSYHGKWTTNRSSLNIASGATFDGSEAAVRVDALTGSGALKMGWNHLGGITTGVSDMTAGVYNSAGSATFSGVISANSPITTGSTFATTGNGTQILTGTNTYVGTTTIGAGSTLRIGNGGATGKLGSGAVVNNSTLVFNRDTSTDLTVGNAISGTGNLTQEGLGKTILTGANTYAGTTTISAGTLQVGSGGSTGTLGSGGIINNTLLIFNRDATADLTVSGAISGTGTVTQSGAGKTILTADNSYSGATSVGGGTLQVGNGGATGTLGTANSVAMSNNATLAFNKNVNTTIDKSIGGNGNLTANITGDLALTSNIAFTGTNTINLSASGSITETAGSLAANNLYMTSTAGSIGTTTQRIQSNVNALSLSSSGDQFVTEVNGVSVSSRTTNNGNINLQTTNGTLTVDTVNSVAGIVAHGAGNITLAGNSTTGIGVYVGNSVSTTTGDVSITGTTSATTNFANPEAGVKSAATISGRDVTMVATVTSSSGNVLGYYGAGGGFTASRQLNLTGTTNNASNGFYSYTGAFSSGTGMTISGTSRSGQAVGLDNNVTLTNGNAGGISITGTATNSAQQAIGLRGVAINNSGGDVLLTSVNGIFYTDAGNAAWGSGVLVNTITNSGTGAVQVVAGNGNATNSGSINGSIFTITQNGNAGVLVSTSGTGNVTTPKVINNGNGNVVIAAGSAIATGTGSGGQVLTVAGKTITNSAGKTYIYTGTASGTGDLSNLISPSFDTLYYQGTTYTQNAAFNTAFNSTITGGANAQVLFRDSAAPSFTLSLPSAQLSKIYGQTDPTIASLRTAVQTAYTAGSGAATLTTDVAAAGGGSNTFGVAASEVIAALTGTRAAGENVNGGTPYIYILSAPSFNTVASGSGVTLTIGKATLTAALRGTATKEYNGLTNATLNNSNYDLTGWVSTEGASVTQTLGAYTDPNVVNNTTVSKGVVNATLSSANYTANSGTDLNNYNLPTSATGNIGVISAAPLTIKVNNTSAFVTQDANTATDQGFSYTTFKNGESAATALSGSFTRTFTGFDSNNVAVSNTPASGTYTGVYGISATPTAVNGNYTISLQKGSLVVVPADKLLITIGSQTDTYGNRTRTNAGTTGSNTITADYCFNQSIACSGANIASLTMTQLSGNQWKAADNTGSFVVFDTSLINPIYSTGGFLKAGNYVFDASEIVPLSLPNGNFTGRATNGGVLTVNSLAMSPNTSNISKTYDGSASLSGMALTPTSALTGDEVSAVASTGAFASANVGTGINFTLGGLSLTGADAANYSLSSNSLSGTGSITAKQLTLSGTTIANKTFDGTTAATVSSNGSLQGLVGVETLNLTNVAAAFETPTVGTNKPVNVSATLANGTGLASNYTLAASTTYADINAANNNGNGSSGSGSSNFTAIPKPIIPTDNSSEGGGGSGGSSSAGNPYLVIPSNRPNSADRCTPNTLEDCVCETQEARPVEGLAICYQPKKIASNKPTKGRRG